MEHIAKLKRQKLLPFKKIIKAMPKTGRLTNETPNELTLKKIPKTNFLVKIST